MVVHFLSEMVFKGRPGLDPNFRGLRGLRRVPNSLQVCCGEHVLVQALILSTVTS